MISHRPALAGLEMKRFYSYRVITIHYSKGRIVVVSPDKKLVKTIDVPSPAAPNLYFGPDEKIGYIMAVDDQSNAPYWGKVYEVPNT